MPTKSTKTTTSTHVVNKQKVMTSVASTIDFIKSQIAIDLSQAKNSGMISLENEELKKLSRVIEISIQNSFIKSSGQIESALKWNT